MRLPKRPAPPASEITPEAVYLRRREFLQQGFALAAGAGLTVAACESNAKTPAGKPVPGASLDFTKPPAYRLDERPNAFEEITTYNNFYEFGTDKTDPSENAHTLKVRPWTLDVSGACAKAQVFDIDAMLKAFPLEERIYRLRCVEAWSMVIPWIGFPLAALLKRVEPTSRARFVAFESKHAPDEMPGQRSPSLAWPYVEGLRIDEAMHPLTILAVGLYGKVLPNQNGAPVRLVVPWKYGFKSIKSVVRIRLVEEQPPTSWNRSQPREYGFYSNVNPDVDHPRWSQRRERRIGEVLRRPTLPFNGYADEVAGLYAGLDLKVNF